MIESTTELVDPPNAGNEVETLIGFLDFQRDVLRRKTEGEGESRLIHTVRGIGYVLRETPP